MLLRSLRNTLFPTLLLTLSSGPVLAGEEVISVSREECDLVTRHTPREDVTFKPGVDARGRDVVPADLNRPFSPRFEDRYSFVLDFQPLPDEERLGLSTFALGVVSVDSEGRVYFNGELLNYDEELELQRLCREALDG